MTPSAILAISYACCGVEIPKPTATGLSVYLRTVSTILCISVFISFLTPVTPKEDTQ